MRRSAAPSVIAKKRQDQGKENAAGPKSNVCEIGRRKFKSPVANWIGLVAADPSALKPRSEGESGSCRSEGGVVNDAPLVGRNPSQVLKLIDLGRVGAEGNKTTTGSDNVVNQSANSLPPSSLDSIPDCVGNSECEAENLESSSVSNLKFKSILSESSSTLGVKRSFPDDFGLENANLDITRKKHHFEGESLLDGKIVCVEELPAISEETIITGEPQSEHLNASYVPDTDDLKRSEMEGAQHFYVKEKHDIGVVSKPTKPGTALHGLQRQRPQLHEINLKVASKPCQEVVSAEYYSVMYCPRKPNTKRKGPWSDGIIVCQGRSCTLQDLDGKAVTKSIVQGLKDMPEGATLEVNHQPSGPISSTCLHFYCS